MTEIIRPVDLRALRESVPARERRAVVLMRFAIIAALATPWLVLALA